MTDTDHDHVERMRRWCTVVLVLMVAVLVLVFASFVLGSPVLVVAAIALLVLESMAALRMALLTRKHERSM